MIPIKGLGLGDGSKSTIYIKVPALLNKQIKITGQN